jgi:hypothetical protein
MLIKLLKTWDKNVNSLYKKNRIVKLNKKCQITNVSYSSNKIR